MSPLAKGSLLPQQHVRQELWLTSQSVAYDYRMTMIAAIAADDGIVCISDGRSFDSQTLDIRDTEKKIFVCSPFCNVLIAGGIIEQMEQIMETVVAMASSERSYADEIANYLHTIFTENTLHWLHNNSITFIIAGYDSKSQPYIAQLIQARDHWSLIECPPKGMFCVAGSGVEKNMELISKGFRQGMSIADAKDLAQKSLDEACKLEIEYKGKRIHPVGGIPNRQVIWANHRENTTW